MWFGWNFFFLTMKWSGYCFLFIKFQVFVLFLDALIVENWTDYLFESFFLLLWMRLQHNPICLATLFCYILLSVDKKNTHIYIYALCIWNGVHVIFSHKIKTIYIPTEIYVMALSPHEQRAVGKKWKFRWLLENIISKF